MSFENKSINQSDFNLLLAQAAPQAHLADLLIGAGYNNNLRDLHIHLEATQQINFSDCQFDHVKFSGHFQAATFEHIQFNDTVFYQAQFSFSTFNHTQFTNSAFVDSNLTNVSFIQSEMKTSKAWNSDFSNAAFIDSSISHSLFAKAKFDNVLDYQNTIDNMHVVFSQDYHHDYAFNQANTHFIQPTVALVGDTEWHDTPYYIINKYHGNPITISQYAENIDTVALTAEVQKAFADIQLNGLKAPSIAQHVLQSDQPTINAIKAYAYEQMAMADSIWIPGGPDLHPEFYGEENNHSYPSYSYYREILEFSLTEAALALNKPIIGICHGSQLVNVYLGGTLHQHVDGQSGISPLLVVVTDQGLLGSVIHGDIEGPSYHHQAVKDVAPTLEVVATYDGVIKATQATDGSKVMLCQFHPEYEHDQNSENILHQFLNLSAEDKLLSTAIALSDVVDFGTPMNDVLTTLHDTPASSHATITNSPNWFDTTLGYIASFMPSFMSLENAHMQSEIVV